ncbi:hypothetical protein [Senegalia sp. (in: firmicutes)]|uniref:hypothetical protein n=1 Tax=Senegalia sp. (in: firmicutes) TaxID=1924098 RepID=UPI003F9CA9EE
MIEENIKNILYSAGAIDRINEEDNDYRSYKVQLMISTIKSLTPLKESDSVIINLERLKKEIEFLKDYYTLNPLEIIDLDIADYWTLKSSSFNSILIPIVLSNEEFENIRAEIIKSILVLTGNIYVLMEQILLGKLLDIVIKKEINLGDIISSLKEEVINFSQKEFLREYSVYYKKPIEKYSGNFTIDFEKVKIHFINLLNEKEFSNKNILIKSLTILDGNKDISIDELFLSGISSINNEKLLSLEYKNSEFIEKISDYLIKLRKGRINLEDLKVEITTLPNIFNFKIGDIINHPLLNKSKLIKRYMDNDREVIEVITKSGLYKLQK